MEYTKECPNCHRLVRYATKRSLTQSITANRSCKSCVQRGRKRVFSNEWIENLRLSKIGSHQSIESREKQSETCKRKYKNTLAVRQMAMCVKQAMHRPEVRKKHLDALAKSKWLKVKTDVGQLELLEKWNRLGFHFEPNYQVKTDSDLFYVDGYDPVNNVVLEYDGKYHTKISQKRKDLVRQQKIIDALQPIKFWRYNAKTKSFCNVKGQYNGI